MSDLKDYFNALSWVFSKYAGGKPKDWTPGIEKHDASGQSTVEFENTKLGLKANVIVTSFGNDNDGMDVTTRVVDTKGKEVKQINMAIPPNFKNLNLDNLRP